VRSSGAGGDGLSCCCGVLLWVLVDAGVQERNGRSDGERDAERQECGVARRNWKEGAWRKRSTAAETARSREWEQRGSFEVECERERTQAASCQAKEGWVWAGLGWAVSGWRGTREASRASRAERALIGDWRGSGGRPLAATCWGPQRPH